MKQTHTKTEGVSTETEATNTHASQEETLYSLPVELQGVPNLPPSLLPPSAKDLTERTQLQWGDR